MSITTQKREAAHPHPQRSLEAFCTMGFADTDSYSSLPALCWDEETMDFEEQPDVGGWDEPHELLWFDAQPEETGPGFSVADLPTLEMELTREDEGPSDEGYVSESLEQIDAYTDAADQEASTSAQAKDGQIVLMQALWGCGFLLFAIKLFV